ncbi:hypothetical protein IEQ44_00995 [Nocardioides sp. Y6]|uniref:Uncharacterized protein n=1 Tax=Nocardioides malaquae TaxID=2773426 RepID=A0ABR9RNT7_9ACTN|nr:hypothetical protein [Nocardioides malaquae]MBE7323227.1 hypothetical protein [Nocardioides malaquae]
MSVDLDQLTGADSWAGVRAVVAGFGVAGFASTDNLNHLGAEVVALDVRRDPELEEKAELLGVLGADVRLGDGVADVLPEGIDLLVVSPGWRPDAPLVAQAHERGVPVWGEVELAWRLRHPDRLAPWLVVTGERGRGTAVRMLDAILRADGRRSVAAGNVGLSLVEVVMDPEPYDVIAVDVSSQQLHHTRSMRAESAAVMGLGHDMGAGHPGWHRSEQEWLADTAKVYHHVEKACVYDDADERTRRMVEEADVVEGARAIGTTFAMPAVGMVGLVEEIVADRAFIEQRTTSAAELCTVDDLASQEPEFVAAALVAAALARAHGVSRTAVRDGLRGFGRD